METLEEWPSACATGHLRWDISCDTIYENKLKWTKDLKVRPETIKLLRKTQAEHSLTKILAILFFDLSPKTKKIKAKIHSGI